MGQSEPGDAASFARRHAGEHDASLTPAQRELLGRVIARRIERGAKLEMIARAAATALFDVPPERARRLGRDEALRAHAWEALRQLRAAGATQVVLSPTHDACPACVAAGGLYPVSHVPAIPVAGCTHAAGCRCRYLALAATSPGDPATGAGATARPGPGVPAEPGDAPPAPGRPWYRNREPRPHGPRWTDERRTTRRPAAPEPPARGPRPAQASPPRRQKSSRPPRDAR